MKLKGRYLSIEMQGEEVKLLQSKQKLLHPFIAYNKQNDRQGNGFTIKLKSMGGKI